jgi:hypothetical protein
MGNVATNRSIYNHAECFMRRFKLKISASGTCQNNYVTLYIDSSVIVWKKYRSGIVLGSHFACACICCVINGTSNFYTKNAQKTEKKRNISD